MIAKTHVALAGGGVDVHAETAHARFSLEKGDRRMGLGVFEGRAEVIDLWLEHVTFPRNLEMLDLVVRFRVEDAVFVGGEVLAEVDVVAVRAEALPPEGLDDDFAPLHRGEDLRVGKDHGKKSSIRKAPGPGKRFLHLGRQQGRIVPLPWRFGRGDHEWNE